MINTVRTFLLLLFLLACSVTTRADTTKMEYGVSRLTGDVLMVALPVIAITIPTINHDSIGTKQAIWTIGSTVLITHGMKYIFNHTPLGTRPDGTDYSFPSGHTSSACSGAAFIGQRYGWKWGSLAMLPAAFVGWSRIHAHRHHLRDVIAGCSIGIMTAIIFTKPQETTQLSPWYENKTLGLTWQSTW